jgi:hypothetical protein
MMTRDALVQTSGYASACNDAPPPLHVYDTEAAHANWHPLPRPAMQPHPPGCTLVTLPQNRADLYGDDPTDPGAQTEPRSASAGMIGRLNIHAGRQHNVQASGVRR